MIERKRLEELIEQGATVWEVMYAFKDFFVEKYDLKEIPTFCKKRLDIFEDLHEVFETKEEAEWYKEFGCIERTERLVLPNWQEFDKQKFVWFFDSYHKGCCLHYLNCSNKIYINLGGDVIEIGDYTQENYTLACRKAKELFLGSDKDE